MIDKTTLKQEADKLFASTSYEVLWGSPAGEFFTCEKIGSKALKKGEKLIKFEKAPEATPEGKKEKTRTAFLRKKAKNPSGEIRLD